MITRSSATFVATTLLSAASAALVSACSAADSPGAADQRKPAPTIHQDLLGICQPLTCCFPSGGGWQDNPFEDALRALGCSKPQAYTESYGQSDWWLYSTCPASLDLTTLVLQYSTVSPYYSQIVVNECLELHAIGGGNATSVFVEWDPTCSSCAY
jgi:hypothetical protein